MYCMHISDVIKTATVRARAACLVAVPVDAKVLRPHCAEHALRTRPLHETRKSIWGEDTLSTESVTAAAMNLWQAEPPPLTCIPSLTLRDLLGGLGGRRSCGLAV